MYLFKEVRRQLSDQMTSKEGQVDFFICSIVGTYKTSMIHTMHWTWAMFVMMVERWIKWGQILCLLRQLVQN